MVEGHRKHHVVPWLEDAAAGDDGVNVAATGGHAGLGLRDEASLERV